MIINSNVKDGKTVFHKLPVNEERQKASIHAVSKGREDFEKSKHIKVCSSHSLKESQLNVIHPDPTLILKIL